MFDLCHAQENRRWAVMALLLVLFGAVWACAQGKAALEAAPSPMAVAQGGDAGDVLLLLRESAESQQDIGGFGFDGLLPAAAGAFKGLGPRGQYIWARDFAGARDVMRAPARGPPLA